MTKSLIAKALIVVSFASVAFAPNFAAASEGARSVGGGIKCAPAVAVKQADGTYIITQYCYKAI